MRARWYSSFKRARQKLQNSEKSQASTLKFSAGEATTKVAQIPPATVGLLNGYPSESRIAANMPRPEVTSTGCRPFSSACSTSSAGNSFRNVEGWQGRS